MYFIFDVGAVKGNNCISLISLGYLGDLPFVFGVSHINIVSNHEAFIVILLDEILIHSIYQL